MTKQQEQVDADIDRAIENKYHNHRR
jgi:hypothetical protein